MCEVFRKLFAIISVTTLFVLCTACSSSEVVSDQVSSDETNVLHEKLRNDFSHNDVNSVDGKEKVTLEWDEIENAESYNFYYCQNKEFEEKVYKIKNVKRGYKPDIFIENETYYYFVTAIIGQEERMVPIISKRSKEFKKTNIIIIFSDDAGYADFGFQIDAADDMKKITPNINRIANEGAIFTNAYMTSSVCSPSRAGLLTGRYQQRYGHEQNIPVGYPSGLPLSEKFISDRLAVHGYKSGCIGKWHLGYPDEYHPYNRNFDFFGLIQGSRSYFPIKKVTPEQVIRNNAIFTQEKGYVTDRLGNRARKFIKDNKNKPFFLFVPFTAPHSPFEPKLSDFNHPEVRKIKDSKRRKYAGLIRGMDRNVGKILNALKTHGLEENTLVIFTNDNGGKVKSGGPANNFPLKGGKGALNEGGIRVPMAMRWTNTIKSGSVINEPVISLDFLPTFISLAEGTVNPDWKLDGIDLLPILKGEKNKLPIRNLFWRRGGSKGTVAMRRGKWKYVFNKRKNTQAKLYNLNKDIKEKNNIASKHPSVVSQCKTWLAEWESQLREPLWK